MDEHLAVPQNDPGYHDLEKLMLAGQVGVVIGVFHALEQFQHAAPLLPVLEVVLAQFRKFRFNPVQVGLDRRISADLDRLDRHKAFPPPVLLLELSQPPNLRHPHLRILFLPAVERHF